MEDDEDIHSHQSTGSGSHHSNPRISVTVASAAPPPQNTLTLALPIQQPRTVGGGGGGSGGGAREDCWSEGATAVLIEAWGERYLELSRGNLKQKHWKEVADIVSSREDYLKAPKTDIQCKNRIDTVKKKYKLEKAKIAAGGGPSTWSFYNRLDELIGPIATAKSNLASATPPLRSVPVGIPVGVRSAPVQSLRLKQQQERQQQQQLLQQQQQQQQQQLRLQQQQQEQLKLQQQQRKRIRPLPAYSESDDSEPEPDSPESDPYEKHARTPFNARSNVNINPRFHNQHQQQKGRGSREKNWGDSVRELTKAIMKFGEAYEHAESSKLQQMVEMQKQSMKFAKELELQRMQFFMKTQMELSQLKQSRRNVETNNNNHNHNHHSSNHNTINNNNHSDDSNN
ncbi:trihelix transcription factor ASIL2-like [Bidens hawaiensis]|uniref:trihelix transcription factor ASIL2-like n=1 Tax=Bidens hawaiensis TaxID=980011 RepID=UPI004049B0C6